MCECVCEGESEIIHLRGLKVNEDEAEDDDSAAIGIGDTRGRTT